jgi:hypothetical protein
MGIVYIPEREMKSPPSNKMKLTLPPLPDLGFRVVGGRISFYAHLKRRSCFDEFRTFLAESAFNCG